MNKIAPSPVKDPVTAPAEGSTRPSKRPPSKPKSVTLWWALSYFAIITLAMVVALGVYISTERVLKDQVKTSSEDLMAQVQYHIDAMVDDAKMMAIEIALNPQVDALMAKSQPLNEEGKDVRAIMEQLRAYRMANQSIDQMYLYKRHGDEVVTDRALTGSTSYYRLQVSDQDEGHALWRQRFNTYHLGDFVLNLSRSRMTTKPYDGLSYVKSLPLSRPDLNYGAVVISLKTDRLMQVLNANEESDFLIVDGAGKMVWSSGASTEEDLTGGGEYAGLRRALASPGALDPKPHQWFFSNEQQVITTYPSNTQNWHYVLITPYKSYWAGLERARFYLFFGMVAILILGGLLTHYAVKRHYEPVKQILSLLEPGMDQLQLQLQCQPQPQAMPSNKKMPWEYQSINRALSQHQIQKLLKGEMSQSDLDGALRSGLLCFEASHWLLIKMEILVDSDPAAPGLIPSLLGQFPMAEAYGTVHPKHEMVLFGTQSPQTLDQAQGFLEDGAQKSGLMVFAPVVNLFQLGSVKENLDNLWDFAQLKGQTGCLSPRDLAATPPQSYHYPIEKEHLILSCFQKYDFSLGETLLCDVLRHNMAKGGLSHSQVLALKHNLLTTLLRGIHLIGHGHDPQVTTLVTQALDAPNILDFEQKIRDLMAWLAHLSAAAKAQACDDEKLGLVAQVNALIQAGATHPDFSLTRLSEEMEKSPYYLSNQYKQVTGSSISDAITQVRLERAVSLMKLSDEALETIAEKSGFGSLKTFARLFSKGYGVTPGKYRADFLRDQASVCNALSSDL